LTDFSHEVRMVLLRVYAKCAHGAQTETLRRIFEATKS
jgi:hypothetical protein